MNLFIIGSNLPKKRHPFVLAELRKMTKVYPRLDPETSWYRSSPCGTLFAASMHIAEQVALPRRYVDQSQNQAVFFTGLPVSSIESCRAHQAESLATHWDQVSKNLEGQYVIVRAAFDSPYFELLTDILGYEQVFYTRLGDLWLVSNSVSLLEQISKPRALDSLGVSLFLSTGWVGADRTLRSGIRVIPAGQYLTWKKGDAEPRRYNYYSPSKLARLPRQAQTASYFERLADDMIQPCRILCHSFDNIKCSLTGGRDSRLIAAMLIGAGLKASYYTYGYHSDLDVKIATQIAKAFDLPYEVTSITKSDVMGNWDDACWQSVRQTDGMRTLMLVGSILRNLDPHIGHKDVILWGAGGEIARCFYGNPHIFLGKFSAEEVQCFLLRIMNRHLGGLVRKEATALVRDYIRRYVMQCMDDGFDPIDIPDVFGMYQADGRRIGNIARGLMSIRDVFSPFCSRAFVEATFAMPALHRYSESLHYNLMKSLAPELHKMPFDKKPWPLQHPQLNLFYSYGSARLRSALRRIHIYSRRKPEPWPKQTSVVHPSGLFETKREQLREICLDQKNSSLWDFVDRAVYERITSSTSEPPERFGCLGVLYRIATLFYYDGDVRRKAMSTVSSS